MKKKDKPVGGMEGLCDSEKKQNWKDEKRIAFMRRS